MANESVSKPSLRTKWEWILGKRSSLLKAQLGKKKKLELVNNFKRWLYKGKILFLTYLTYNGKEYEGFAVTNQFYNTCNSHQHVLLVLLVGKSLPALLKCSGDQKGDGEKMLFKVHGAGQPPQVVVILMLIK